MNDLHKVTWESVAEGTLGSGICTSVVGAMTPDSDHTQTTLF